MSNKIDRRTFIKTSTAIGAGLAAGNIMPVPGSAATPGEIADIGVATGPDYIKNTFKAVELIGGIEKFVPKNAKVAILANPQRNNPGAFTKPEILKATIQLCKKAGAKEIVCISWLPIDNCWEPTGLKKIVDDEKITLTAVNLRDESLFEPKPVPNGKSLKEARVMKEFYKYDLLISLPICKDHAGNKFTGTLKNLMGLNSPMNNRGFHKPNWKTDINDIKHLDQCIADLNTIITPRLNIVDATEFITTNGPFGPGKLSKPQKVVAGTDRVAMDAYCCTLFGLKGEEVFTIKSAYEQKLGEIDLKKVKIKEAKA